MQAQVVEPALEALFTEPKHYVCYHTSDSILCDGKLNEKDWALAQWTDLFVDIEGASKPLPYLESKVKMLYDDKCLYIAAELEEKDIWGYLKTHDDTIYHDNDFEVFLDPEGTTHNYFELEINALKTAFDLYMNKPYRNAGSALITWDIKDLNLGIDMDGTLNDAHGKDKKWVVEMAIPFASLSKGETRNTPVDKELWRINFSRVEWDSEFRHGRYNRKRNPASRQLLPEHNWVWSPQGIVNMHYPERWGYLQFSSKKASADTVAFRLPYADRMKRNLWMIYYKEHAYYDKNKHYSPSLEEIGYPGNLKLVDQVTIQVIEGKENILKLEATTNQFQAIIENNELHEKWMINQEGELINRTLYEQKGFH